MWKSTLAWDLESGKAGENENEEALAAGSGPELGGCSFGKIHERPCKL